MKTKVLAVMFLFVAAIGFPTVKAEQKEEKQQEYKCDGRTRCTQMRSCEEAKFFLKNCPDVKMDGDNDGIPCEDQWCKGE